MEKIYNKLVRDNIPKIIEEDGEIPIYKTLDNNAYWESLIKKDFEELEEVKNAKISEEVKKELADKLEVIMAMAEFQGFTLQDIINESDKKRNRNGGFQKRLFLEKTITKE